MAAFLRSPGQVDLIVTIDLTLPTCSNNDYDEFIGCDGVDNISTKMTMNNDEGPSASFEVRLKRLWDDPSFLNGTFIEREPMGDPGGIPLGCANVWGFAADDSNMFRVYQYGEVDCPDPQFLLFVQRLYVFVWPRSYNYAPWTGEPNIYWLCEAEDPLTAEHISCDKWTIDIGANDIDVPGAGGHFFWGEVPSIRGLPNGTATEPSQITADTRQGDGSPGFSSIGLETITRNRARYGYNSISVSVEPVAPEC